MYLQSTTGKRYFDAARFLKVIEKNNGTFKKPVNIYRRVWKFFDRDKGHGWAYGVEEPQAEWLRSNATAIQFVDKDKDLGLTTTYTITMEHFFERAVIDQLGAYERQFFIRTDQMDSVEEKRKKVRTKKEKKLPPPPPPQPAWQQPQMFG